MCYIQAIHYQFVDTVLACTQRVLLLVLFYTRAISLLMQLLYTCAIYMLCYTLYVC
jgi:hypothetical protein